MGQADRISQRQPYTTLWFHQKRTNNESLEVFKIITSSAAMATLHPKGLPPYVDPCSPGLMVSITSSLASTADT